MYLVFTFLAFRVSHVLGQRLGEMSMGRGGAYAWVGYLWNGLYTQGIFYETRGV